MTALYLETLVAIAALFSVLVADAWMVQRRTGNPGWVDTISTFSLGLAGVGGALWPVEDAPPATGSGAIATASCAPARSSRSRRRHDPAPDSRVSAKGRQVFAGDNAERVCAAIILKTKGVVT